MVKMAEPYKHPDSGVYYLRRQIPVAVRPEFGGRSLWKESLGTKDVEEARRSFAVRNGKLEQRFAEARAVIDERAERDALSPSMATKMVERAAATARGGRFPMLTHLYWSEETAAALLGGAAVPIFLRDDAEELERQRGASFLPGELWLRVTETRPRSDALAMAWHMIEAVRGLMQPGQDHYPEIERNAHNDGALVDAVSVRVKQELASLRETLKDPFKPAGSRLRSEMLLRELLTLWQGKAPAPGAKTIRETAQTVNDFVAYTGNLAVGAFDGDMLLNFRDAVASLPRTMTRAERALDMNQRLARFRDHDLPKVDPASVKRRVGHIQALLSFAYKKRWILANVGTQLEIEGYSKARSDRRPFLDGELTKLFTSPLFLQPQTWKFDRATVSDVTLAWCFILGLTNGARLEEIDQTDLRSIKADGGVCYIDLGPGAQVKTEASRRMVPLHGLVLDLGFDDYVAALRQAGATRLFPELKRNTFGRLGHDVSRLCNRAIDRHVTDDTRLVFHSLRHTFKDLGRDVGIDEYILDQLVGHAPVTVGSKYGIGARLTSLKREIEKIRFEMVDWARVQEAFRTIDWADVVGRQTVRRADLHRLPVEPPIKVGSS